MFSNEKDSELVPLILNSNENLHPQNASSRVVSDSIVDMANYMQTHRNLDLLQSESDNIGSNNTSDRPSAQVWFQGGGCKVVIYYDAGHDLAGICYGQTMINGMGQLSCFIDKRCSDRVSELIGMDMFLLQSS